MKILLKEDLAGPSTREQIGLSQLIFQLYLRFTRQNKWSPLLIKKSGAESRGI